MKLKKHDIGVHEWARIEEHGERLGGRAPVVCIARHYPTGFFALVWDHEEKSKPKRLKLAREKLMGQLHPVTVEGKLKLAKALLRSCRYGLSCSDREQVKEIRENVDEFLGD